MALVGAAWLLATAPVPASGGPLFLDRSAEWGLEFRHFNGMSGQLYYAEMMGPGGAMLDYDEDGDLDLFLPQGRMLGPHPAERAVGGLPPRWPGGRLFRQDRDPTGAPRFVDVTARASLVADGYGMGVAVGDIDGDGDPDLYLSNLGPNQLWRNEGNGRFTDVTAAAAVDDVRWSLAATFLDIDGDDDADLYLTNYLAFDPVSDKRCTAPDGGEDYCGPTAYPPLPDRLWRNRGDGTFEDVSVGAGIAAAAGSGMGVISGDFDRDGHPDLFVANDAMANLLWRNRGDGTFVEEGALAGVAVNFEGHPEGSMGIAAGDVNGDGAEDLLVTHIFHETNTLYLSQGRGLFLDGTLASGLGRPSWSFTGFGAAFLDYDGDGWLDLAVVNGAVSRFDAARRLVEPPEAGTPRSEHPLDEPNQLFRNQGDGRFQEVTEQAGEAFARSEVSRGLAVGDLEDDGDPDLLVVNNHGPARLLENRAGSTGTWLGVDPRRRDGAVQVGAEVWLIGPGGERTVRRVRTEGSYASASDPRALFGLPRPPAALEVRWPAGRRSRLLAPPVGRYLVVVEAGEGGPP